MNIPPSISSIDVSNLFVARVPQFLDEIKANPTIVLVVVKNEGNASFMEKIHPTDSHFYFYMEKFISLPSDVSLVDSDDMQHKVHEFFS